MHEYPFGTIQDIGTEDKGFRLWLRQYCASIFLATIYFFIITLDRFLTRDGLLSIPVDVSSFSIGYNSIADLAIVFILFYFLMFLVFSLGHCFLDSFNPLASNKKNFTVFFYRGTKRNISVFLFYFVFFYLFGFMLNFQSANLYSFFTIIGSIFITLTSYKHLIFKRCEKKNASLKVKEKYQKRVPTPI